MAYSTLLHRSDSIYDDQPSERYQFPPQYLRRMQQSVGDWIVYLEPSKVRETRGYFAIARVERIIPDPKTTGMYLALIERGSYLEFANPVPFNGDHGVVERGLLNEHGNISGRAQSAVRPISSEDFLRIVELGLHDGEEWPDREDEPDDPSSEDLAFGFETQPQMEIVRPLMTLVSHRKFRDAKFKLLVRKAYDRRCALTGLRLINGRGRPEVEAAHIKPVSANGPDSIRNGIALSGTVHWMFDRGMLSLADDLTILTSRQLNYGIDHLLNSDMRAIVPKDRRQQPHPAFLAWHRENLFKT